ncbi:D-3-phosphoglycerate dehydrogenase [Nitrosococcus oceani ATCC 19707]|uniref:D-3-phosphoglycerate dehydrogenase n=2 Tax=Nitrosococcus oceani TaxID=1229 RepID=Q3JEP0_NITOC|nr:3-phosphoglycerate dehydrogenase family protein [Nitrosococcus oceani]ABA56706.1 D-3-phosphoglycerate dehydrogenase [Nitrosococcus oceani ATCC 19707]EDZ65511.1 D-isomer specific 2-hydroxyacid dehydrogenase, catalytic domain, putative [Nitrosococcus oceani AFC27]KFI20841.1 3-phosphoglycerate dehydrogenase [Nitrosococcus oceani C-27]GEM21632.1 3-phosphoglycerate dehydrogenase [Nitrosococcus oceani]
MYKILTLNNISIVGLDRLPRDKYEVASEIQHPDAILVRSHNMHEMAIPPTLKAVGRAGAGVNNIPVARLSEGGVAVFNAPGANANAVKEAVLAGLLVSARNICQAWEAARTLTGTDKEIHREVEAQKKRFVGVELPGRTLGVVGLGSIGVQVANAALALGMRVVGYDPQITVQRAWALSAQVEQATNLDHLLSQADFLSLHVPLLEATRGLINRERLRNIKPEARLLNFARAEIVDEDAVVDAIEEGKIAAYICDFPSNRLKGHPQVIALPHLGASTYEAEENCAVMVVEQIREFLENGNVQNSVNFPDAVLPRTDSWRLAIANANVPTMVAQISTHLAEAGLNIIDMLNKSQNDLAYTLVDVDRPIPKYLVDGISAVQGMLSVRAL